MTSALSILFVGFLVTAPAALVSAQPLSGGTASLDQKPSSGSSHSVYWDDVPVLTEVFTREAGGPALKQISNECSREAAFLYKVRNKFVSKAPSRGLSEEQTKHGLALIDKDMKNSQSYSRWFDKAARVLQVVDFVSTTAKAVGYLAEGDKQGAVGIFVSDVAKKVTVAAGEIGLSGVPVVGPTLGAEAGERVYEGYIEPAISGKVDAMRVAQKKEEMLGMRPPPVKFFREDGSVGELPKEYGIDEKGKIFERTPDEQKKYEADYRKSVIEGRQETARFEKDHPDVEEARKKFENKEISMTAYTTTVNNALAKNRKKKWASLDPDIDKETEKELDQEDSTQDQEEDEKETAQENEEEEGDKKLGDETGKPQAEILKFVNPAQGSASITFTENMSSAGIKNIVTVTLTAQFWNVGALAPGYGSAALKEKAVSSRGPVSNRTMGGTFSGGPNGVLRINNEGETLVLKVVNGSSISTPSGSMTITNPGIFNNWPDKFK